MDGYVIVNSWHYLKKWKKTSEKQLGEFEWKMEVAREGGGGGGRESKGIKQHCHLISEPQFENKDQKRLQRVFLYFVHSFIYPGRTR